ncbi:MAG: hypothetical protein P1P88_02495 [Bacteroidales bacterium]|nr:hypothetical protein [Bacteroidales bacterium]
MNMLIDTKVPDSIQTRLKVEMKGMPLSFLASPDGDTIRILNLVGQGNKDQDLITASYIKDDGDEVPVGYLNLMSYEEQPFNLVIVPVDGEFNYTASALQKYLNKVYAPAIVSWMVAVADEPLEVEYDEGEANGLNTSRTLVSKFNSEMKAIIDAMEKHGDYIPADDTYYLFVMEKAENESLNGLMPFNSKYGFLFTGDGPDQTKLFRTIAHELGHGVFKLRHNFDQFSAIEKLSTQNLMDYTNTPESATVLRKFQWDEIISPRLIALGWSEEKYAEGEDKNVFPWAFRKIDQFQSGIYLAPSGMPIYIDNSKYTTLYVLEPTDNVGITGVPEYSILALIKNGIKYTASVSEGCFEGYLAPYDQEKDKSEKIYFPDIRPKIFTENTVNSKWFLWQNSSFIEIESSEIVKIKQTLVEETFIETYSSEGKISFNYLNDKESCQQQSTPANASKANFKSLANTDVYVEIFESTYTAKGKPLGENEELLNSLTQFTNQEKNHSNKSEKLLGEYLADKLRTYELFNNGRKFIVVTCGTNTLSTNQNSWNDLAKKVFEKANLGKNDILITIPFIQLKGTGIDKGEYFLMPGIAYGSDIKINFTELGQDYIHTQNVAECHAGAELTIGKFILDVFTHTTKKALIFKGIYLATDNVECIIKESQSISGLPFNKTIILYRQNKYTELSNLINGFKERIKTAKSGMIGQTAATLDEREKAILLYRTQFDHTISLIEHDLEKSKAEKINELSKSFEIERYYPKLKFEFKEEFLEAVNPKFAFEGDTDTKYASSNAVSYIQTKAFNELREELSYNKAYFDWDPPHAFTSVFDVFIAETHEKIITGLDAASIIFGFVEADVVTDFIGLIYSSIAGDKANASGYAASLLIFGPQSVAVKKGIVKASKGIINFSKKKGLKVVEDITDDILLNYAEKNLKKDIFEKLQKKSGKELNEALTKVLNSDLSIFYDDILGSLKSEAVSNLNKLRTETRNKILDDIILDANLEKYVNDNPLITKAFSAHKDDLTAIELDQIKNLIEQANIPIKAKQWANRGLKLRNMLKQSKLFDDFIEETVKTDYKAIYARQVTLRITNKSDPTKFLEIVPDYLINKDGKFIIVDAKYTTKEFDEFAIDNALTPNQNEVFKWFEDGDVGGIEIRANPTKAELIDASQGQKLTNDEIKNFGIHIIKSKADAVDAIETTFILK